MKFCTKKWRRYFYKISANLLKNKGLVYNDLCSVFEFVAKMWRVLRKLGKMLVRKVSSQISLCSLHRLTRDDTFCLNWIFAKKRHHLNEKFHKSGNCRPWLQANLGWQFTHKFMPSFLRTRHKCWCRKISLMMIWLQLFQLESRQCKFSFLDNSRAITQKCFRGSSWEPNFKIICPKTYPTSWTMIRINPLN